MCWKNYKFYRVLSRIKYIKYIKKNHLDNSPIDVAKKEDWDNSFKNEFYRLDRKVYLSDREKERDTHSMGVYSSLEKTF